MGPMTGCRPVAVAVMLAASVSVPKKRYGPSDTTARMRMTA